MYWLLPAMIASLTSNIVLVAVNLYLYLEYRQRYLLLFFTSWLIYDLRFVFEILSEINGGGIWNLLAQISTITSSLPLLWGMYLFTEKRLNWIWVIATVAVVGWVVAASGLGVPFTVVVIPVFLFAGWTQIWSGVILLRSRLPSQAGKYITAAALILWGIHKLNYPFLRQVTWFAPWGFLLGALLALIVAFGIFIIYYERTIVDLRKTQQDLYREREQFSFTVNQVPAILWSIDKDLRFNLSVGKGLSFLNLKPNQVVGMHLYDFLQTTDPENESIRAHHAALKGISSNYFFSYLERTYYVHLDPFYDTENRVQGILGIAMDITEERAAQQALQVSEQKYRELSETLEQKIYERTAQLEQANRELESFSYSVSHDLRAPLRAINNYSKILIEEYRSIIGAEGKMYLDRLGLASQRLDRLINDLLNLAHYSRQPLKKVRVDLTALAKTLIHDIQFSAPDRMIQFVIQDGMSIFADESLIHVVLLNLLDNAVKFTTRQSAAKIEVSCIKSESREDVVCVRDNGIGFDMSYVDKLFQPFQRLHSSDEFSGTGIGLATVMRIINRHGGKAWAESSPGSGAQFYFSLPAGDAL